MLSTLWIIETKVKCSIVRADGLNLVNKNAEVLYLLRSHWPEYQREDTSDFLNAAFTLGNAQKGRGGMTLSSLWKSWVHGDLN